MTHLLILGSSNAIPSRAHANTHLALITPKRRILVDCGSNPLVSLEQAGVDVHSITDIILTHFHPDHVSGLAIFLMDMWLMHRQAPLNIFGLAYTLERAQSMLDLYNWKEWPNFYRVYFHTIPQDNLALVFDDEQMRISASPVKHLIPNIGLRVELKQEARSFAYSSDTEPCPAVLDLAAAVDVLLHEAAGATLGHSSPAQAAQAARQAEVGALVLIHYPTGRFASGDILAEARAVFPGRLFLAEDLMQIDLDENTNLK